MLLLPSLLGAAASGPSPLSRLEDTGRFFRHFLPDGHGELQVVERRLPGPGNDMETILSLRSAEASPWTSRCPYWSIETLETGDFDRDGRSETLLSWRGGGTGARLLVELWRFDARSTEPDGAARRLFRLPRPAVEGQLDLEGDLASGHQRFELVQSLPDPAFRRPYLRWHRSFYLRGDALKLLVERFDEPETWRQRQTLVLQWMKRGDWERARLQAETLLRESRDESVARRRRASRLVAFIRKKSRREGKARAGDRQ